MPTYNGEKYLDKAIESILNQTYTDFELIIVNDCSTDLTLEIVKKYSSMDKRIKVYSNEINQKLPKTLNIGFEKCIGEYLTWSSDDNIFKPNAFEIMAKKLDENHNVGFVYSCEEFIDENDHIVGVRKHPKDLNEIYCANIVSACFLYRREVHELLNGYNINKFLTEDYDFFLRAYENFEFLYIPEVLYQYRKHCTSLTSTRQEDIIIRTIDLLKEFYNNGKSDEIKSKIYRGISNFYLELAIIYYEKVVGLNSNSYDRKRMKMHFINYLFKRIK